MYLPISCHPREWGGRELVSLTIVGRTALPCGCCIRRTPDRKKPLLSEAVTAMEELLAPVVRIRLWGKVGKLGGVAGRLQSCYRNSPAISTEGEGYCIHRHPDHKPP